MIYNLEFRAMGTSMLVSLECTESDKHILQQVPSWFEYWETIFSRFRPESELSRLNRASGSLVQVSTVFWDVLQTALTMEKESGGLVTVGLLDALNAAGYDRSFELLDGSPSDYQINNQLDGSVLDQIIVNDIDRTVLLPPGMKLDFGGIGKGWAAQQTAATLGKLGPVLVDAGGDIAVQGILSDGSLWPIGVEDPFHPEEEISQVVLTDMGVATSGKNRRHWMRAGVFQHHIIDPRTYMPTINDVLSATVIGPNVIQAEMAAKVLNILGSENGMAWLEKKPGLEALLITDDGGICRSQGFKNYERYEQ